MASGFGSFWGNDLNWASNTKACIWGQVVQSVDTDNRKVTVTVYARAGVVQRNYRRPMGSGETFYGAWGYTSRTTATIDSSTSTNEGTTLALSAGYAAAIEVGEHGRAGDGWVTGEGCYGTSKSKTYSYGTDGAAISGTWSATLYSAYNSVGTSTVSGSFTTDSISPAYTAPSTPTTTTLVSDKTANKAYSQVSTTSWGTNSSRSKYEIICDGSVKATDSTNDPASMYWTLPNTSTNTSAGVVNTWYGRATNNHALSADSAAKYVTTPSAPTFTITAGSGTNPQSTVTATVTYRGGNQNSTTCDNYSMARFQFGKLADDATGVPGSLNNIDTSDKTATNVWEASTFPTGHNYKFYARAINSLGGSSSAVSTMVYCPQGVYGNMTSRTPESVTITTGTTSAGTLGSASGGSIACYELKWGTSQSSLNNTISAQTSNVFTITGLTPNQTIYYQVTAKNNYGLNNVSTVSSATSLNRYSPQFGTTTVSVDAGAVKVATTVEHTGGLTVDGSPVTSMKYEKKPSSSSTWTTISTDTVSLSAGDTYTKTVWTNETQDTEGDYDIRITASNGTDSKAETITLAAPSSVTLSSLTIPTGEFIQIKGVATAVTDADPASWALENVTSSENYTLTSTSRTATITSHKHLSFNTEYTARMKCINNLGLWRRSATKTVTTGKRFNFYGVRNENIQLGSETAVVNGVEKVITEVYYIKANALGNLTAGTSLKNATLNFITQPLHYRPENVKQMTLSNGSQIRFGLYNDESVFGIWQSDVPTTIFFSDGEGWAMTSYTFPNSTLTISSIDSSINASAAFSTTTVQLDGGA